MERRASEPTRRGREPRARCEPRGPHRPVGRRARWVPFFAGVAICFGGSAHAHLNSPDIFIEDHAGPYPVILIVHMPPAVPGEAEVQIRLQDRRPGEDVEVFVLEIPPQGEDHAPGWVRARPSEVDPDFFSAPMPLMVYGLWQMRVKVTGDRGEGVATVPVSARVVTPRGLGPWMGSLLAALTAVFFASLWSVLVGFGRDAHRPIGSDRSPADVRRGWLFAGIGIGYFVFLFGFIGAMWLRHDARYEGWGAPPLQAELRVLNPPAVAGKSLALAVEVRTKRGDLAEKLEKKDGTAMHVVFVRPPGMQFYVHVHPREIGVGRFRFEFTPPEPGAYRGFVDVFREGGIEETIPVLLDVEPGVEGRGGTLADPDGFASSQPAIGVLSRDDETYPLGDGLLMRWERPDFLQSNLFVQLGFQVEEVAGGPVREIEPFGDTPAELIVLRSDGEVFARLQPMAGLTRSENVPSARVTFPYGFPSPGTYRLWVQVRVDGRMRAGVFDAVVY